MEVKTHLATTKEKEAVVAFFDKVMAQIDYPVVSWVPAIYPCSNRLNESFSKRGTLSGNYSGRDCWKRYFESHS